MLMSVVPDRGSLYRVSYVLEVILNMWRRSSHAAS
jgi:hypothetical protein